MEKRAISSRLCVSVPVRSSGFETTLVQAHIRANPGHSLKTVEPEGLMWRMTADDPVVPTFCIHGTPWKCYGGIVRSGGLLPGRQRNGFRKNVHFMPCGGAWGDEEHVEFYMMRRHQTAIWIDLPRALAEGVVFYMSNNNIILSPGLVKIEYFAKWMDVRENRPVPFFKKYSRS